MQHIFKDVLKKVKPSEKDIKDNQGMFLKIHNYIKKEFKLNSALMGSVAKNTFLKGDNDLDIFVFFPQGMGRETLEKKGLEVGRAVFNKFKGKYVIEYAEHPYTKGHIDKYEIEIVPAYMVIDTKHLFSAVDRTPFHTEYVKNHLENKEQVLILKQFLKGIDCYGSDLKTEGFSGYLCEILTIKYGAFDKLIKAAQEWDYQTIIDLNDVYSKGRYDELRKKFENQPIIVIDPTDKNRNVAAVLSKEKLAKFIFYARKFYEKPSIAYFFQTKIKIDKNKILKQIRERNTNLVVITFEKPKLIEDILYPQLRRLEKRIVKEIKHEDFNVIDSWVFGDVECGIAIELVDVNLPKFKEIAGPSIFDDVPFQEKFEKKYKNIWFTHDRFYAETKRGYIKVDSLIKDFLKGSEKKLLERGVPKNLIPFVKKYKLLKNKEVRRIKSSDFWSDFKRIRLQ